MNARQLVRRLGDLGIDLTLAGSAIRYRSKTGPPPPGLISEMKRHRDELVSMLTRREALQWPPPRNGSGNGDHQGPLSWAQRKVWATSFFRDDGAFNVAGGLRLTGRLNQAAFDAALQDVHRRHPSLHTVFTVEDGEPAQRILSSFAPTIVVRDLAGQDSNAALMECLRECARIAASPLGLDRTPPVQTRLYRLADAEHVFFVVLHHIIADGVSVRVLMNDLARCYNARADGHALEQPADGVDMIDHARFEEEYLRCADLGPARRYWSAVLRGVDVGRLPLPPRLEPVASGDRGEPLTAVVDAAVTTAVRRLASASRSTPFLVVAAAVSSMLSRFTGRDDMVIGMPVARRDRAGLEELVGLLADMTPIRLDAGGNPTFLELVQRTRTAVLGALGNAVTPVELALDDHPSQRAGEAVFNVVLTDNGGKLVTPQFRGLDTTAVEVPHEGAKFDLNFLIRDDGDTLHMDVEFDIRTLHRGDVLAMVSMAQRILAGGAADRASRALDLATTPKLVAGAPGLLTTPRSDDESLFSRLTAIAEIRGDAIAIACNGAAAGYRSFCHRAGQVARGLHQLGLGEGDVVAIGLPRGIDLVTAMLGVMGCGAACLVLNDAWPQDRVRQVLSDANVRRIIAAESDMATGRISVAQLAELGATAGPTVPPRSSSIAYLIYTSGSTGQPNGVQVSHRNVLNLLDGANVKFRFDASDTWTLFHACSFDFSIWEIFGCLLTGGKLVVIPQTVARDPEAFVESLRREQVTVLNLTPSALSASLAHLARNPSAVERLRYLIFGGEALPVRLVERWYRDVGGKTRLVNMYGITETSVHASWRWLEPGRQPAESDIGEALPGISLHVLHDNGRPVEDRCVGEIYVGGAGVSLGYLRQPRKTALRFVPDPFSSIPGSRMYRSGDVGRRNGPTISCLGRRDSQVQVNGFRVELSEVEAALAGRAGVAAAAAAVAADHSGASIVAVVVPDGRAPLSPAVLVRETRALLPRYMVPSSVAIVPELPLTANGKVDRSAVAASAAARVPVSEGAEHGAPPDSAAAVLLELYREVLHHPSVSTTTDFFDAGGDSMRAIRLVSLGSARGLLFGVQDVYAAPMLKHLAARAVFRKPDAEALSQRTAFSLLPAAKIATSFDGSVEDAYPMTALQFGMMYLQELAPESGVYHIVLSYRIGGRMDANAFRTAAQAVTDMHPILRTSFDPGHPGGPLQRVHARVPAPVEFEDLSRLGPEEQANRIAEVVQREQTTGFDLASPGLFRLVVLTLSEHEYQLLFTHHHAILDGWSVNIFFDDLHSCYTRSLAEESASAIPRLQNVFAEYVALEQSAMNEPEHLEFWQARTSQPGLLAPDRPGQPVMRQVRVEMRKGMIAELRSVAARLGVPVKALLLAAHLRILAWLTGREEVVTGSVVNCRPELRDSDRVLGLFLNQYPIRVELTNRTWADIARAVHLDEQAMMPHRWYPHALIQQHYGPTPIFDTYFNFTEFHTTRRLVTELGLDVRDVMELESTHYSWGTDYTIDVRTGELRLVVEYDNSAVTHAAPALTADAHELALAAILADPDAVCLSSDVPPVIDFGHRPRTSTPASENPVPHRQRACPPDQAPSTAAERGEGGGAEPESPLESSIRAVWHEVLGAVKCDVSTSFFDAGGTSLTAMRVVSRLRALHGDLSMETFMDAPTIAGLARSLAANEGRPEAGFPSACARDEARTAMGPQQYPLTRAQQHLWDLASQVPELPLFGMPGAIRAEGHLDLEALDRTFAALVERHAALRTRIAINGTGPVQVVEPHAKLNLETIDLRASADPISQCEQTIARAVLEPMDLTRTPLVRTIAFQLTDDLHVIYLNIHHIVCDGVSLDLLMREAAQVYGELSSGAAAQLCRAPLGSGEVAQAEAGWTSSPAAAAQRSYWVDRLAPPWPSLTGGEGGRFGPRTESGILERLCSATLQRQLPATVLESVRAAARRHGLTDFMVILTAFASTLRAWSGRNDIRVATMVANRVRPEREPVVGLLANTIVLRLDLEANHEPVDLSRRARRACIEAYERQELPFEDVLASLKAEYPVQDGLEKLFEVMLLMQEETPEMALSDGLRWTPYKPRRGALNPPLTLTTCDFVLAARAAGGELALDFQYTPATLDRAVAESLLDDIAASIGATARVLQERQ